MSRGDAPYQSYKNYPTWHSRLPRGTAVTEHSTLDTQCCQLTVQHITLSTTYCSLSPPYICPHSTLLYIHSLYYSLWHLIFTESFPRPMQFIGCDVQVSACWLCHRPRPGTAWTGDRKFLFWTEIFVQMSYISPIYIEEDIRVAGFCNFFL